MEEEKKEEFKEEVKDEVEEAKKSYLSELKSLRDEIKEERQKLEEIKTIEIVSGKAEAGIVAEKPKPKTDEEVFNEFNEGKTDLLGE